MKCKKILLHEIVIIAMSLIINDLYQLAHNWD